MPYKVGDKVTIVDSLPEDMRFGIGDGMHNFCGLTTPITKVIQDYYRPNKEGEDGCLYHIQADNGDWSWPSSAFKETFNKLKTNGEYEIRLQEKRVTVSRGDQYTGSSICCRRCKATVTVGHLSHQEVSGN